MIPTQGRIVEYTLSEQDAEQINFRRVNARRKMGAGDTGFIQHCGNDVRPGDTFPLIITQVWGITEESTVNGQVMLDGNDVHWVTSVTQGHGERTFRPFPRVE